MTAQPLHQPRVSGLVTAAQEEVRAAADIPAGTLRTHELGEAIQRLSELESQATSLRLQLSAEADRRQVANSTADSGTDAWLATLTGSTRAQMAGGLWLARMLEETYPATRVAFAAGQLRVDQVKVIVNAGQRAPAGVTPEQLHEAEELLVGRATGAANRSGRPIDARRLRQLARRMFETISPELADVHESDQLRAEEQRAERETWFALSDNGDGTWSGRFVIPELHGNLLQHALERLTSPRRHSRAANGERIEDHTLPGQGPLNTSERCGAGLCELIEHLPTAGHTGTTTEVVVTMRLEALVSQIGAARLDTGIQISAHQARRLACESGLIPLVLGGRSEPLDLGRRRRLHNRNQRRVLAALHDTCAVAGCERPFAWCEIHHQKLAWARGGRTDMDNGLPLCWWHHRRAHDDAWELRERSTGEWQFHRRT